MNKKKLTWETFDKYINKLAEMIPVSKFKYIYGVPRGGLVVAIALAHKTGLEFVFEPKDKFDTLIVDDICDKGYTLSKFKKYHCATLCYRENDLFEPDYWVRDAKNDFIIFPWETMKSAKMDYLEV